jgi:hypothetical protein
MAVVNQLTEWICDQGLIPQRDFMLQHVQDPSPGRSGHVRWTFCFVDPGIAALFKLTWGSRDL